MEKMTDASDTQETPEHQILKDLVGADDAHLIDDILAGKIQLVLLMQSTHLDWNWIGTNLQYFREGVNHWNPFAGSVTNILDRAIETVSDTVQAPVGQRNAFSLAEIGFLKQYLERKPAQLEKLRDAAPYFSLIGGAVETPDDILPNGEAFIRTYLLSRIWAEGVLPDNLSRYAYLPDDFGHAPCLPATFHAMGIEGFGFARCPGSDVAQNNGTAGPLLVQNSNVDFLWKTDDGSSILAHYLQWGYNQGEQQFSDQAGQTEEAKIGITNASKLFQTLFNETQKTSDDGDGATQGGGNAITVRSPYCMIPFGNDFGMAKMEPSQGTVTTHLLSLAKEWNDQNPWDATKFKAPKPTYAVVGNFDQYMRLVAAWSARTPKNGLQSLSSPSANNTSEATFWGTPYWTGFYASQPELKNLHQSATRAMLAAESLAAIAGIGPAVYGTQLGQHLLDTAWSTVAISTSHNLLTGCGPNTTTYAETQPFFRYSKANAMALRASFQQSIASSINPLKDKPNENVVLFNELGLTRTAGRVAVYHPDPTAPQDFTGIRSVAAVTGKTSFPARPASDGSLHILADIDALGYQQFTLETADVDPTAMDCQKVTSKTAKGTVTLSNGAVTATISGGALETDDAFLAVQGKDGKTIKHRLKVITDNGGSVPSSAGGIFRFGTEYNAQLVENTGNWTVTIDPAATVATDLMIQQGCTLECGTSKFEVTLKMCSGDPFVSIAVTGASEPFDALMASFSFDGTQIDGVTYGTPHGASQALPPIPPWPSKDPKTPAGQDPHPNDASRLKWNPPYFIPTHDYIAFNDDTGAPLGAVYHTSVHAWSVRLKGQPDESMPAQNEALACLLRNAQGPGWEGAGAADDGTHTVRYAIRVADGVPLAKDLPKVQLLAESRAAAWPIAVQCALTPNQPDNDSSIGRTRNLADAFSLASVVGDAVINAAKIGSRRPTIDGNISHTDESLILRVFTYDPGTALTVAIPLTAAVGAFCVEDSKADDGKTTIPGLGVSGINALEEALTMAENNALEIQVDQTNNTFTFTPQRVLTTLRVDRNWINVPNFPT